MLLYTLIFFLLVFAVFLRPISTLIHELGHGIPALLLTDGKVTLYIGSYGNPKKSFRIEIGRLEFFFRKNPFHWKLGLCKMHDQTVSINNQIFITLMGPIMSLVLAAIITYFVFFSEINDDWKAILFFFGISTYFDFFANIIPKQEPIKLDDGTTTYNDGKNILNLIKLKKLPPEYSDGVEKLQNKQFSEAGEIFYGILQKGYKQDFIYRLAISSFLNAYDHKKAATINQEFELKSNQENFDSNDYNSSGLIKSYHKDFSQALNDYEKSLELNPNNSYTLNNRGYTFNLMEEYEKAIIDFDRAIELEPEHAYPYNNRGLAKIKLGRTEEGLLDIDKSLELDQNNSYAHMNLGVHFYDLCEYEKALEKFELAYKVDANTYEIQKRIEETKSKLR
jgi:Tfp pilus assembly protein PilF